MFLTSFMGSHPLNLGLRFILEIIAWIIPGFWIWHILNGWWKYPLCILVPICIATLWAVFAVKDDPSRSGKTVVRTPGLLRLLLELAIFLFGAFCLHRLGYEKLAFIYLGVVIIHNIISYDRIFWLLKQR